MSSKNALVSSVNVKVADHAKQKDNVESNDTNCLLACPFTPLTH